MYNKNRNYNVTLNNAIRTSGYDWRYFADYKARFVAEYLSRQYSGRILDYGCGVGNLARYLQQHFPEAQIDGYDISSECLSEIPSGFRSVGTFTTRLGELQTPYGCVVVSNVLHHTSLAEREEILKSAASLLIEDGYLFVFEHNPFNPMTRYLVWRSPLDLGAKLVSPRQLSAQMRNAGYYDVRKRFIICFPQWLRILHACERYLERFPLGTQYALVGRWRG